MIPRARAMLLCLPIWVSLNPGAGAQAAPIDKAPSAASLDLKVGNGQAVVLYFIASDCPVSNRLLPEMLRIERRFSAQHIRFFFVYPNTNETAASIRAHRTAYGIQSNTLTDPDRQLARLTGANVTPEAAVLIPRGKSLKTIYTGRIDDRFLSLGTERPAATRHDLEDAITAVLARHPVPPPGGPPVGCAFMTLPTK